MSTPPFLTLPACASAGRLATARGEFAVLRGEPSGAVRGTALLVPGFTGSKEDFIALLEPLAAAGFRTVALDQRGQYETGGPADRDAYALPELGRDLTAVTEALAPAGPLHLLAHSFGGFVAREAMLSAPAGPLPWASLTLLSTGPGPIDPAEAARTKMLLDALDGLDLETIWQLMRQLDGPPHRSTSRRSPSSCTAAGWPMCRRRCRRWASGCSASRTGRRSWPRRRCPSWRSPGPPTTPGR